MAKDRTYTFRASADLADRLEHIRRMLAQPSDDDVDVVSLVGREFERRLFRARKAGLSLASQSESIRLALELVAGACKKVADDLYWAEQYALAKAEKTEEELAEDHAYRHAALRLTADRWAQDGD